VRRIEIARLGNPAAAKATPTRRLAIGGDPQRPALAPRRAAMRLSIGRIDRLEMDDAHRRWRVRRQNSDAAAAAAKLTTGWAMMTNSKVKAPERIMIVRTSAVAGSKAGAGSSKYMILTMRR
jgi:hypothetical protein